MGAEDDGVCLTQLGDQIPYLDDLNGVKAYGGFIQNDDLWVSKQCLCNANTLLVALGKLGNAAVFHILNAGFLNNFLYLLCEDRTSKTFCLADKAKIVIR